MEEIGGGGTQLDYRRKSSVAENTEREKLGSEELHAKPGGGRDEEEGRSTTQ